MSTNFAGKPRHIRTPTPACAIRRNRQNQFGTRDVTNNELFEITRLVLSAEIAKIHTIEWTTQMLYNEPLYLAMNANWSGLLQEHPLAGAALEKVD